MFILIYLNIVLNFFLYIFQFIKDMSTIEIKCLYVVKKKRVVSEGDYKTLSKNSKLF